MPGIAPLTAGAIYRIMQGVDVDKPVLQILGLKKISGGTQERLRLLISDGKYFNSYAMLATQLNHLHGEGKLEEYTVLRVEKYITSVVNKPDAGKRVLVILELTILNSGAEVGSKIGNPVPYTEAEAQNSDISAGASASVAATKPSTGPIPKVASKPTLYNNDNNNSTLNQSLSVETTHPIASISPYQNRWVIKARVTAKTPIRTWSNAKGEGKLFSMDLMDESGEIRVTAFKEQCDRFYDMIEVDRVYFISKCQLKPANKQYTSIKNDYEMTFTKETVVQPCEEEDNNGIPEVKYDFVPISQIANIEPKSTVDVIGVCKEAGELQVFTSRTTNKELKKRDLTLIDNSNAAISLTLWNDEAVNFDGYVNPVILLKGARVGEFNGGKSLSVGSAMKINPDTPEGHKLRGWYDNGGGEHISNSLSARTGGASFNTDWLTFEEARIKNLGAGDKPDYFQCKATIHNVKVQNAFYKACPQPECRKKVIDENNGHYRCERCNAAFPDFKYKLLLNMRVGDWTSNRWVTCFSDTAEQLLNRTAQEVGEALDKNEGGDDILSSIQFNSYVFKLRSKFEFYGDVNRNKLVAQSITPINYKEYNKYLINSLKQLTGISKMET